MCLRSLPNPAEKPALAEVHCAEERELKALDEFIAYKTRCLVKGYQNVEKILQAIEETEWLKDYLEHFPDGNREAQRALPFWPHEQERRRGLGTGRRSPQGGPVKSCRSWFDHGHNAQSRGQRVFRTS